MAGCCEIVRLPDMEWLQTGNRRNLVASVASGVLVSLKRNILILDFLSTSFVPLIWFVSFIYSLIYERNVLNLWNIRHSSFSPILHDGYYIFCTVSVDASISWTYIAVVKYGFCKKLLQYKWTSDQLNTFFLTFWLVTQQPSQKVREKVFNWSEDHLYWSNFLQNPYFSE